jgi:hypothetical protein
MYEVMVASVCSNPGDLLESCVPSRKREVAGKNAEKRSGCISSSFFLSGLYF